MRDSLLLLIVCLSALVLAYWSYQSPHTAVFSMHTPATMLPLHHFHAPEQLPDGSHHYRWTREHSTVWLPNPGGTTIVQMTLAAGAERTVSVQMTSGDTTAAFLVGSGFRRYAVLLPPATGERFALTIEAPVMEVAQRTLGVMVGALQVSGRGRVPIQVAAALLVVAAGGYALFRHAWGSAVKAAALVVLLQGAVLWWQGNAGWRYALAGPVLLLAGGVGLATVVLERWVKGSGQWTRDNAHATMHNRQAVVWLLLAGCVALLIRLLWLAAPDPVGDLELAARRMGLLFTHGLSGAYIYDGDYMPLRLYLLYGLSQLVVPLGGTFHDPLPPVTLLLIKLPGLLTDLATMGIIYAWSMRWCPPHTSVALALLYALTPPVWINVAWWGQVDALLMLPLLASVVLLERAEGAWSWLCWCVALLIKPQAIVLAPVLFVATLCMHGSRGIAQGGLLSVGLFAVVCAPLALTQQGPGLMQAYLGSVGRFPKLTSGAYNLWYLLTLGESGDDVGQGIGPLSFRQIGMLLVASVALLVAVALFVRCTLPNVVQGAAVLALAFFVLPTQIHERYLFLSLAFMALCIAVDARMVIPFLLLVTNATLNILGTLDGFLPVAHTAINRGDGMLPLALAVINLLVLVGLLLHLLRCVWQPSPANRSPAQPPGEAVV